MNQTMDRTDMLFGNMNDHMASKSLLFSAGIRMMAAAAIVFSLFGCAASQRQVGKPDDQAWVHFTCRLPNGETAISTYKDGNDDPPQKSLIYIPRKANTPIKISTFNKSFEAPDYAGRGFEDEVSFQLSKTLGGRKVGEKYSVEITSEKRTEKRAGEYSMVIARVRERPREMRFTRDEYQARTKNNSPEIGRSFIFDPAIPGRIDSVSETEVVVRFFADPGQEVFTPFGKGTVRVLPNKYEIVINAQVGTLVRTGGWIGRISAVDEWNISIDYSHPFGWEKLQCDVLIEPAGQEGPKREASKRE
ncbi:MAG: hypothetical protein HXY45_20900 [Syntrophaceae bacterium]|nr:hypothetical protein [Syntrophaceae bacterium]